jgi:hypothetical protein
MFFFNPQIANPQILGLNPAIANTQIFWGMRVRNFQIHKFPSIKPQIANSQNFLGEPVPKLRICDLRNLFADRPSLSIIELSVGPDVLATRSKCNLFLGNWEVGGLPPNKYIFHI